MHMPQKEPWTRGDKAIIVGVIIAVGLTATFAAVDIANSAIPDVHIPRAVMPSPNGFDYAVAAAQSAVDGYPMQGYSPPPGAPRPARPLPRIPPPPRSAGKPDLRDKKTMALSLTLLKANAGVESSLRQAFQYQYLTPSVRSYTQPLSYLSSFRRISRVLAFQSEVDFARGDVHGAATSALDVIHLGNLIPRGGTQIHAYIGSGSQAIGRKPLWRAVASLDAATARSAASELEKDDAHYVSCVDTLGEDKLAGEAGLVEIMRQPHWQSTFQSVVGNNNNGQTSTDVQDYLSQATISKRAIMSSYVSAIDSEIAHAKQPYNANPPPVPTDPIVKALLVEDHGFRFDRTCNQAENRLLMIVCALRAYKLEHGVYPSTLAALTPTYLHAVPLDPFTAASPVAYRMSGKSYILYSVGPDTIDDGGKSVVGGGWHGDNTYRGVEIDSKGDIVAGIDL
jgi:hypothetical protein